DSLTQAAENVRPLVSTTLVNGDRGQRTAHLPGPRVYLTALAFFAAMIGSLEAHWRIRGFLPDVPDSAGLWDYHRTRVVGNNDRLIVAIGTSRIRADLRPEVLRESLPSYRYVQLGINGPSSSLGLLAEISCIPRFRGIVLCDILPPLMDPELNRDQSEPARQTVAQSRSLNTYVHSLLCDRFVVLNSALTLREVLAAQGDLRPKPNGPRFRVYADRTLEVSYASPEALKRTTKAKLKSYEELYARAKRYKSVDEFKQAVAGIAEFVARIQHNGGQVVFLRLPASGARLALEESAFPSSIYFSALASVTSAPWIDFRDLPYADDFECPDESHLSFSGAEVFTKSLVAELNQRALVRQ
ncbi:MAG TPA: hypothetical protein VEI07_02745, partial [Planctomycetaceae bacterium]|nr:hypothetical protein [Planctomycetaceae bacterium]